jgi:hypothetical protein
MVDASRLIGELDADAPEVEVVAPPQAESAILAQSRVTGMRNNFICQVFQELHTMHWKHPPPFGGVLLYSPERMHSLTLGVAPDSIPPRGIEE